MLLDFLGWSHEAATMRAAVKAALFKNYLTSDLGGNKTTKEVGEWLTEFVTQHSTT
jgi:isocitrate/isopropylmalate dehydrogenase